MSYSDLTFKDKNPIKRWLQMSRLRTALRLAGELRSDATICDFGAGSGELCKVLAPKYPQARIICYEPTPSLLVEAQQNLRGLTNVEFEGDLSCVPEGSIDVVFCLEVFEHLPPRETSDALRQIKALLNDGGVGIIGVPNEIGLPALYKGLFRMTRRYGKFDATPRNVFLSFLGMPPTDRPVAEIASGIQYHFHHMGFDYRRLRKRLGTEFHMRHIAGSPVRLLGSLSNPETYFVVSKEPWLAAGP
ncbi:class I SAM-dependent methyltransferase [Ramlibacter sp.]|uniref:class I SAM-dependent methyltransferase n=1 Tax=Ramlibacter sp. TaxID=1917967 RepID=UPI00262AF766|nr:class I SAM-dependent methyltransferase [Ramlibacter sp.]MDB5954286.1 hypothetical protein [Ramlibacter sp.]